MVLCVSTDRSDSTRTAGIETKTPIGFHEMGDASAMINVLLFIEDRDAVASDVQTLCKQYHRYKTSYSWRRSNFKKVPTLLFTHENNLATAVHTEEGLSHLKRQVRYGLLIPSRLCKSKAQVKEMDLRHLPKAKTRSQEPVGTGVAYLRPTLLQVYISSK